MRFGTGRQGAGNIVYSADGFGSSDGLWKVTSYYGNNYLSFKIMIDKTNYTYSYYLEDSLIETKTVVAQSNKDLLDNVSNWGLYFRTWSNITIYVKNIRVKAL